MDRGKANLAGGCVSALPPGVSSGPAAALRPAGAGAAGAARRPPGPLPVSAGLAAGGDAAGRRLVERVFARCHGVISELCRYSSVPPEFLGALVANESGGNPQAMRFEPAVYRQLKALAEGKRPAYAGFSRQGLDEELAEMLHPKADSFHQVFLTGAFRTAHARELAASHDEALRELATSWGLTQIMGYHLVGRKGTVRDLLEPHFHFRLALELLAQFAERYQLDLAREFAEMFRCWNTGQPYGQTFDPDYAEKGRRRMEIYRELFH
jgi:hypothetical protein